MSKRAIDEVAAEYSALDQQTAPPKKKKKKKKDKNDKAPEAKPTTNGTAPAVNGTDAVNGDTLGIAKRRKHAKKEKKDKKKTKASEGADAADVDVLEAPELSKEDRKATKAAKRAAKEAKRAAKVKSALEDAEVLDVEDGSVALPPAVMGSTPPTSSVGYTENTKLTTLPKATVDEYLAKTQISINDPQMSNLRPITSFSYLPPNPFDLSKFSAPTPIQAGTWPFTLSGHDCVGVAETGSGKTLAFAVPAIRHVTHLKETNKRGKLGVRVVMVSPTRELAMQIYDVVEHHAQEAGMHAVCIYGGVPKSEQVQKLKTANIIVATPGRLNDLIGEGSADLSKVSFLVLDEADRMLDKGNYPAGFLTSKL